MKYEPINCPECGCIVPRHGDGSLKMHSQDDGQVCDGTNQKLLAGKGSMVSIGNVKIPILSAWIDEDTNDLPNL